LRQIERLALASAGFGQPGLSAGQPRESQAQVRALQHVVDGLPRGPHPHGDPRQPPALGVSHQHDLALLVGQFFRVHKCVPL